ncbi:unnamed protein product [Phyllotreta striolata]|uniref:Uncharacterized protein n=1 Tax=Phyllotreta striolata TaxID=444603 RepID=A0A9N9XNM2_PHYSR|nr:unnamed protein product [Phyllotreta striolata]
MKLLVFVALCVLSSCRASLVHIVPGAIVGPSEGGTLVKGPSVKATVAGPDGAIITGSAIGGEIIAPPKSGGVITSAVSPGIVAPILPIVPVPRIVVPAPPLIHQPLIVAAPPAVVAAHPQVLIEGPSGIIATGGPVLKKIIL